MRKQTLRKREEIAIVPASEPSLETAFSDESLSLRRTSRFRAHDEEEEAAVTHSMRRHSLDTE